MRKPAVVVPNHMLEQFSREWLQIYPQARVLAASGEDLAGERRRQFVARVAANDWDAVMHDPLRVRAACRSPPKPRPRYESEQLAQLREHAGNARRASAA